MTIPIFLCGGCQHRTSDERCKAFPDGIPEKFSMGRDFHFKRVPGDGGIVFKARDKNWAATAADIRKAMAEPKGEGQDMP